MSKLTYKLKIRRKVDKAKLAAKMDDAVNGFPNNRSLYVKRHWSHEEILVTIKANSKIINPKKENLDFEPWKQLYHHNPHKIISRNHVPEIHEKEIKEISSKAVDANKMPIKTILRMIKFRNFEEIKKIMQALKGKFQSRTVCLLKKDKIPNSVNSLRPIQISPVNFKIAEQCRKKLKEWINSKIDPRCYAFKPNSSCENLFEDLKSKIVNFENG